MSVIDALLSQIVDSPVSDVIVGFYNVLVESCDIGLASTMVRPCNGEYIPFKNFGNLTSMRSVELASYIRSDNLLEAAIGMAAISSSLPKNFDDYIVELNARDLLVERGRDKVVGIIGHFPFVDDIREVAKRVYVFEKRPQKGDLMDSDIPEFLPEAEVVGLTATSIINHTFEEIMNHINSKAFVVMLGASTPLSPTLFDFGVHALAGVVPKDRLKVKMEVKEAVPSKFMTSVRRVMLFKP